MLNLITKIKGLDKESVKKETKTLLKEIGELHYQMYAERKTAY